MIRRLNLAVIVAVPLAALAALIVLSVAGKPDVLGAYTTSVAERSPEQIHNIERAAHAIEGVRIRPGAIFSFNRVVGACSTDRGYVPAPAIIEGKLEESPGGGVCQVSSTLYNAALLAGLRIVERHPHSYPVRSVPPGRDATIVWGGPDLRFKNTLRDPITIRARISGGRLLIQIMGKRSVRPTTRLSIETEDAIRPISACENSGAIRYRTATLWREEWRNGRVVGRELVSSDTYKSEPGS